VALAQAKPLSERVAYGNPKRSSKSGPLTQDSANPKAQPKSATKAVAKDAAKGGRNKPNQKNKGRAARPKPKTAEQLDAEMTDYFNNNNTAATTTAAPTNGAAAGGDDMGMEEISV
jgi:THO complex subunit 4